MIPRRGHVDGVGPLAVRDPRDPRDPAAVPRRLVHAAVDGEVSHLERRAPQLVRQRAGGVARPITPGVCQPQACSGT